MSVLGSCGIGRGLYQAVTISSIAIRRSLYKASIRNVTSNSNNKTFLSEQYHSEQDWISALKEGGLVSKVNLEELYQRLESVLPRQQDYDDCTVRKAILPDLSRIPASNRLDVEVFCCACSLSLAGKNVEDIESNYLNESRDLIHRIRLTADACNVQPATGHAIARGYIAANRIDELLSVLDDRLNYGVFLDPLMTNILLDKLISEGQSDKAATVASLLMLQEDFSHPISASLSTLAAHRYLASLRPPVVEEVAPEATEPVKKKKKEEEIKVRVLFLRNPFFDDHFDLRDPILIAGKTLAMASKTAPQSVSAECLLLGNVHYKKWDRIAGVLGDLKRVHADTLQILKNATELPHFKPDEDSSRLKETLDRLEKVEVVDKSSDKVLVEAVQKAVEKHQQEDIDNYKKLYKIWDEKRTADLKEEWARIERERREKEIENRQKILKELDEKIWLIDHKEEAKLLVEKNKIRLKRRYKGKKKVKKNYNEVYIPPEVSERKEMS